MSLGNYFIVRVLLFTNTLNDIMDFIQLSTINDATIATDAPPAQTNAMVTT